MNSKQISRERWASLGRYGRSHLRAMYRTMRKTSEISRGSAVIYVAWTLDVVGYAQLTGERSGA